MRKTIPKKALDFNCCAVSEVSAGNTDSYSYRYHHYHRRLIIMDSAQAKLLLQQLQGVSISGWLVEAPIDYGKSAVVVRASRGGETSAIKVFHPELIERFGRDVQLQRIERERSLIGAHHPHLVQILDGGECSTTGYLFVAMEYLPWSNLRNRLADVPVSSIKPIISQLASAAMFLEERGLAHRDIKPENIAISDDLQVIKLLDLGVLSPFGISDLTDAEQRPFIGTLRYSSPEFLKRTEEPTLEGWRAVTFYQIGAVLHDLLTKTQLFNDYAEPFSLLVKAVLDEIPLVWGEDPTLVPLCKHCLHKNPATRLELVKWIDFSFQAAPLTIANATLEKIKNRQHYAQNPAGESPISQAEIRRMAKLRLDDFCNRLETRLAISINSLQCFPPRATTSDRDPVSSKFCIHLQFERSDDLGLGACLSVHFCVQLIDSSSGEAIYKTSIAAEISPNEDPSMDENHYSDMHVGTADELLSGAVLEAYLVKALEAAYEALDASGKTGLTIPQALQFAPL